MNSSMIRREARKVKKPTKRKCCSALNVLKVVAIYILVIGIVFGGLYGYGAIMELWKQQTEGQNIVTMKEYSQRQVDEQQILQESDRIARRNNKQAYVEIKDPIICSEDIKKDLQNSNKKRIFWTQDTVHVKNEDETNTLIDDLEVLKQETNEDINIDIEEILENHKKIIKYEDATITKIGDFQNLLIEDINIDKILNDLAKVLNENENKSIDENKENRLERILKNLKIKDVKIDVLIVPGTITDEKAMEESIANALKNVTKDNVKVKINNLETVEAPYSISFDNPTHSDETQQVVDTLKITGTMTVVINPEDLKQVFKTSIQPDQIIQKIMEELIANVFNNITKDNLKVTKNNPDTSVATYSISVDDRLINHQLAIRAESDAKEEAEKLETEEKEKLNMDKRKEELKEGLAEIAKMVETTDKNHKMLLEIKKQVEEEKKLEVEQKKKLEEGLETIKTKWNKNRDAKLRQMNETIEARKEKEKELELVKNKIAEEATQAKEEAMSKFENSDLKAYYETSQTTDINVTEKQFFSHGGKGKQLITNCMELCLHIPTCWGFYYEYKDQYCIFSEVIEIQNGDTEDQQKIPDYLPITSLYRRKASLLDVKMKNDDEIALLSNFKIVINTDEQQKVTSDKILAENAGFTTKLEHVNSFLSKDEPKYAEENMEAFISKIVTCTAENNKTEINCSQNAVPFVMDFVAPDGMDIKFELNKTTHSISTGTSSQFWSALPFESNYEVNIVEDPAVYECSTKNETKGTLRNKETVKIDFICAKITKTCEKSTGKGLAHMDFIYLFLIAVGIVTILFICGGFAYLHLNCRKNESDDNNSILVQKVSDVEEQHQDAQANLQITKQKLIKTKKGLKKTVKKLKKTKKDLKEAKKLSLQNEDFDDEFAFGQNKTKRKKEIGWNTYLFK